MTARESIEQKATRYLTAGNLTITGMTGGQITARCISDTGQVYRLGYNPAEGWWCSCAASRVCSHLLALKKVTICQRRTEPRASDRAA
jgi:hypothetical protein